MCYREIKWEDAFSASSNQPLCEAPSAGFRWNEREGVLSMESFESGESDEGMLTHGLYVVSDDGLTLRFCYWNEVMYDRLTDKEALHA